MAELSSVVTRKGQVTLPAEIRRALGLKTGDRVSFSLEGEEVRLRGSASVVARTEGIFRTSLPQGSAEQLRQVAEEAIAEEAVERGA